jgi:hypothetical protein
MWKYIENVEEEECMQHPIEKLAVINERKTLRENILRELYDYYFENKANAKTLTLDEYRNDEERYLACEYLKAKGLIDVTNPGGRNHALQITVYGIDVVENN